MNKAFEEKQRYDEQMREYRGGQTGEGPEEGASTSQTTEPQTTKNEV
jgi:hypothetical protein